MTHAAAFPFFAIRPVSATRVARTPATKPGYRGLSRLGRSMSAAAGAVAGVVLLGAVMTGFARLDAGAPPVGTTVALAASHAA